MFYLFSNTTYTLRVLFVTATDCTEETAVADTVWSVAELGVCCVYKSSQWEENDAEHVCVWNQSTLRLCWWSHDCVCCQVTIQNVVIVYFWWIHDCVFVEPWLCVGPWFCVFSHDFVCGVMILYVESWLFLLVPEFGYVDCRPRGSLAECHRQHPLSDRAATGKIQVFIVCLHVCTFAHCIPICLHIHSLVVSMWTHWAREINVWTHWAGGINICEPHRARNKCLKIFWL